MEIMRVAFLEGCDISTRPALLRVPRPALAYIFGTHPMVVLRLVQVFLVEIALALAAQANMELIDPHKHSPHPEMNAIRCPDWQLETPQHTPRNWCFWKVLEFQLALPT